MPLQRNFRATFENEAIAAEAKNPLIGQSSDKMAGGRRSWPSALEEAMAQPIVFFDIAGPDDAALKSFYSSIFGWEIDQAGQFGIPVATPIKGAIRKDPTEQRIYLGVPDVAVSLSLIEQSGGTVDVPRFEVPGVVVLGLFRDPAGNPMGLVEMDGDSPRVP